jgi:hypothetical protein
MSVAGLLPFPTITGVWEWRGGISTLRQLAARSKGKNSGLPVAIDDIKKPHP